jgi:hypothetical protein
MVALMLSVRVLMSTRRGPWLMGFGEASFIAVAILGKPKADLFRNKRPCPMR